ncbi:MAG: hypothetical protein HUK25_05075 [Treponema sp.]|nr:hypothetical protein [Treponema sp.]
MEINKQKSLENVKDTISNLDISNVPEEKIDELEKLISIIKELASRPDHKEEIEKVEDTNLVEESIQQFENHSKNEIKEQTNVIEKQLEKTDGSLPPFAVMTKDGLKSFENMKVSYFDKEKGKYYLEDGKNRLVLPAATYLTLINPETLNAQQSDKINTIEVTENTPAFVQGKTKIPEFAIITNHGLESFKEMKLEKFNKADNSYVISNGDTTMTVSDSTFKEITAPDRFQKEFTDKTPKIEKLIQSQYDDFFKPRDNTAYNFRHNLAVYCRKEANSPLDALRISKEIIGRMSKDEQAKTRLMLNQIKKEDETINQFLIGSYMEAIKEVPLNEQYIKDNFPDKKIARPFYDTLTDKGALVDRNSTLKVGDTISNLSFNVEKVFGVGKEKLVQDLTVISASKEGNNVILMDKNKSFYEVPRDKLLEGYNKQQQKQQKTEKKHQMKNSIEIGR